MASEVLVGVLFATAISNLLITKNWVKQTSRQIDETNKQTDNIRTTTFAVTYEHKWLNYCMGWWCRRVSISFPALRFSSPLSAFVTVQVLCYNIYICNFSYSSEDLIWVIHSFLPFAVYQYVHEKLTSIDINRPLFLWLSIKNYFVLLWKCH